MPITGSQAAYMLAQSGVMRSGASRSNVTSKQVFIAIAGVHYGAGRAVDAQRVLQETLEIHEVEGETPNTASFEVIGFVPSDGQDVIITVGSKNNLDRLFAGTVITDASGYVGIPTNGRDQVTIIDYTWQLTRRTITQRFTNQSATTIAQAILALAPGFTSALVAEGLPTVDEITFTNQTLAAALSALKKRIGASWKATYTKDVKFGLSTNPLQQTDPTTLTAASALLTELTDLRITRDLSQVITRQPVEGGGVNALSDVAVGETILPVQGIGWYNGGGGTVVSGPQRITYTGLTQASPATAPAPRPLAGAGIEDGVHSWAYTFVTASGESLPSPLAPLTMETLPPAPAIHAITPTVIVGGPNVGTTMSYAIAIIKDIALLNAYGFTTGISDLGAVTTQVAAGNTAYTVDCIATAAMLGRYVGLFRSDSGGGGSANWYLMAYFLCGVAVGGTATFAADFYLHNTSTDYSSTFSPGWSGLGQVNQAVTAGIGIGPSGTTARKVYRTPVGSTQLKLQQTISNNTANTGAADATPDASLGADAPTTDTSALSIFGLTTTSGSTAIGATTLNVASAASFNTTGGWVTVGSAVIRYTGKGATTLTGIPATGIGSVLATIPSGTLVQGAAALTGIPASGAGSILYPIKQGDPVNLRVVVDDLTAQGVIAALLGGGDDGIIEGAVIQDGRISETEARARGTAQLALRSAIKVGVAYATHDKNTHAGRTIGVNLAAPSLVGSFKVQQVTINQFWPARWPIAHATAESNRFTLEDLLRMARGGA